MRLKKVVATFKMGDITMFMNCVQQKFYDVSRVDPTKTVSNWMLRASCLSLLNTGGKNNALSGATIFFRRYVDEEWSFSYTL
jgi:hypothetical protein